MLQSLRTTGLNVAYQGPEAPLPDGTTRHVLATVRYSARGPAPQQSGLVVDVPLTQLGSRKLVEVWTSDEPCAIDERHGFRLARTDAWLFGAVEFGEGPLGERTRAAYERLLDLVDEDDKHLLRVWNSVPDTLAGRPDFLRYMEFCQGRAEAFETHYGADFESHLCAFSAVGSLDGAQCLYFLAAREAGVALENPRQVSAYRYPPRYGPRSPSFARALRGPRSAGGALFLSGTASIVGHESRHPGEVEEQTRETLCNLRALLGDSDVMDLLKVYLRHAQDRAAVGAILEQEFGRQLPTLWLRADICRPELLVEIEGLASPR
jgi:chorismate lyase/3-hydroxybenzoate synthase